MPGSKKSRNSPAASFTALFFAAGMLEALRIRTGTGNWYARAFEGLQQTATSTNSICSVAGIVCWTEAIMAATSSTSSQKGMIIERCIDEV